MTIDQQHWGRSPVAAAPNAGSHYGQQQLGGGGGQRESVPPSRGFFGAQSSKKIGFEVLGRKVLTDTRFTL